MAEEVESCRFWGCRADSPGLDTCCCKGPLNAQNILLNLHQLGLSWAGGEFAWNSAHVLATLCVGAFLIGIFLLWEWKGHHFPLMPLKIFKARMVNGACLTMFVNGWNFVVQVYYIPVFYQLVYGDNAVRAGTLLLPIVLMQSEYFLLCLFFGQDSTC